MTRKPETRFKDLSFELAIISKKVEDLQEHITSGVARHNLESAIKNLKRAASLLGDARQAEFYGM